MFVSLSSQCLLVNFILRPVLLSPEVFLISVENTFSRVLIPVCSWFLLACRYRGKRMRIDYCIVSDKLKDKTLSCQIHGRGIELEGKKTVFYNSIPVISLGDNFMEVLARIQWFLSFVEFVIKIW